MLLVRALVVESTGLELFLHDPRLERYVVSYTNDPDMHESTEFLPGIPHDVLQQALASPALSWASPQWTIVICSCGRYVTASAWCATSDAPPATSGAAKLVPALLLA